VLRLYSYRIYDLYEIRTLVVTLVEAKSNIKNGLGQCIAVKCWEMQRFNQQRVIEIEAIYGGSYHRKCLGGFSKIGYPNSFY
jgi:hypothetical protein